MKLSIGMIVKNEEKNLRKCLEAMLPILQQVDSELIIADTGSTDSTVEIAREFTDQVFHFEWCDDFAAARNATLDRAKGEWYMAIDADECFLDPAPLIDFFRSGEYKKYKSAMFTVRNYSTQEMDTYSDFNAARLVRLTKDTRYKNPIHEVLCPWEGPTKILPLVAGHTGYIWSDRTLADQKTGRNLPMMLSLLEKNPEDARNLMAISQAYGVKRDFYSAIQYAKKGLMHIGEKTHYIQYSLFSALVTCYWNLHRYRDTLDTIDEYFKTKKEVLATDLEMYYCRFQCLNKIGDYRAAIEAGKAYLRIYREYQRGLHRTEEIMYKSIFNADPKSCRTIADQLALTYFMAYEYETAAEKAAGIPDAEGGNVEVAKAFDRANRTGDFSPLAALYGGLSEPQREAFQIIAEKGLNSEQYKDKIYSALCGPEGMDYDYPRLLSLRRSHENGTLQKEELLAFIEKAETWKPLYADAVYLALKYGTGLGVLAKKIDGDDLNKYLFGSGCLHFNDLAEVTAELSENRAAWEKEDVRTQYMLCLLFYWALFTRRLSREKEVHLFQAFADTCGRYINTIYKPEILTGENAALLPRIHRLGYLSRRVVETFESKEYAECLRALKRLLTEEERLSQVVEAYKDAIQTQMDAAEENRSEMERCVAMLKNNIQLLIGQGEYRQAALILDEYEKICPGDESMADIRKTLAERAG